MICGALSVKFDTTFYLLKFLKLSFFKLYKAKGTQGVV